MKLSDVKQHLSAVETVDFELQNGISVPQHFHITEVGVVTKHFIDCGGTVRVEKVVNFQLWNSVDFDHRLEPSKLLSIIRLSEKVLGIEDLEVEVEYQGETIGRYDLEFNGKSLVLVSKRTACLASDACGIPQERVDVNDTERMVPNVCKPGGGCC